jgi:hypothetical protein
MGHPALIISSNCGFEKDNNWNMIKKNEYIYHIDDFEAKCKSD